MKYENIKKLSPYDTGMLANILTMTEMDTRMVMLDKGDVECHVAPAHIQKGFDMPLGKSMKAADRRKRTYHKHQQRERQYRNLGYPLERFSEADLGKMKEGVGMFPETQHQYTLYNRGEKKGEKPITTKQAIFMMEHECWLDEQDAIAEYEEAERLFMIEEMKSLMEDVCWLDNQIGYERGYVTDLMERVNNLMLSINSMKNKRHDCIGKIEKMQEVLNK